MACLSEFLRLLEFTHLLTAELGASARHRIQATPPAAQRLIEIGSQVI